MVNQAVSNEPRLKPWLVLFQSLPVASTGGQYPQWLVGPDLHTALPLTGYIVLGETSLLWAGVSSPGKGG